ncbi:hypothetical protein WA026_001584 [Henosepilachna vigintioctopunctata]|uniref:Uncharacterized protein n=1 Tax=Henosepilachna vigintioctopunctata TaxID=420089 RepID=A0AAW1UQS7_9CUCU
MKFILLVICVFALTNAIRVPTRWHNGLQHRKHPLKPFRNDKYINKLVPSKLHKFNVLPHKTKQKFRRKLIKPKHPVPFHNFYRTSHTHVADVSNNMNTWTPIVSPFGINANVTYTIPKPSLSVDLTQHPKDHFTQTASAFTTSTNKYSPLYKNYRDDKTFENEDEREEYVTDSTPEIERPSEISVKSEHENPSDIPTRPIYPGEKVWAKPGKKHKPYVNERIYAKKQETQDEQPEGYEIFERGEKLLDKKRTEFENNPRNQPREKNVERIDVGSSEDVGEESENEENAEEFVPMTLYTQVRRSGNEEHLPSDSEDSEGGRLKEVIKDSKIHTVYTEEGYEDSAYDHAGREKEAEDSEGYSEYNNEEEIHKEPQKGDNSQKAEEGDQINEGSSKIFKTAKFPENSAIDQIIKPKKETPIVKNKFVKTKEIKTMKLKTNSDGTQMQITSGMRLNMNPLNGSNTEVIEIMPKVVEYFNTNFSKNGTDVADKQKHSEETTATTKDPPASPLIRKRRFTNDLPKVDVKEDFIKNIEQSNIPEYTQENQQNKYPYYNAKYLNKNSPLRYSENMENIPLKREGEMSFYEQANKIHCPEVSDDIDAIPQRIKEVEEAVNNGEKIENTGDSGKSPRLGKLGERINCLKRKYFGDDPLDSPFFEENTVGPVLSPFKIFEEKQAGFRNHYSKSDRIRKSSNNIRQPSEKKYHSKFTIQEIKPKADENNSSIVGSNSDNQYELPNSSQVDIVEVIRPVEVRPANVEIVDVDNLSSINQIITDVPQVSQKTFQTSSEILPNNIYDKIELVALPSFQITEVPITEVGNERKAKLVEEASNQSFQAAELRMNFNPIRYHPVSSVRQRNWYRRPQQTIDPNAYLANQYGRIGNNKMSNYNMKTISHHNEQIVPLEQLNVFSDVLNNIKNGTNDPMKAGNLPYSVPNRIHNFYKSVANIKIPPKKIHVKTSDLAKYLNSRNAFQLGSSTTTTTTTTSSPSQKPKRGGVKYKNTTEKELNEDDYIDVTNDEIFGKKTITGKKSTLVPDEEEDSEVSESHTTDTINTPSIARTTEILGLVPPSTWKYRTIYQPVDELISDSSISGSENLNRYHVLGMKPPSTIHNIYNFQKRNTEKGINRFHNMKLRRGKRNANRKSYFEVVRTQKPTETNTEDNDDDYVPHRPKNWHWDESLKKIVYDKPKEEEIDNDEEEGEEEEVEIEVPIIKNVQQTTTRRTLIATTPINGPSYVDFVKILKGNKNYVNIPDPTTTKKGTKIEVTTMAATTVKSAPTKPPEFFNILSKIRQSDSYVMIKDKNTTEVTTTTTEASAEESEEYIDDSETALSNMQNSPGKGAVDIGHNIKIFDVNDYLPKVKTYSPRTSIDYSKYKTIRRTPPKVSTTETNEEDVMDNVETVATISSSLQVVTPSTEGKLEIIELSRGYSTTEAIKSTQPTTHKILRTRGRRPTTTSTLSPVLSTNNPRDNVVIITATKPKRVYPRRRYPHIRTRTTTERQNDAVDSTKSPRNARHNNDEANEAETKIISLESLIKMDQLNVTKNDSSLEPLISSTSNTNKSGELDGSQNISVDDILKNINQLKEVNVEEAVHDYDDASNDSLKELDSQTNEHDQEDFDDEDKIELSGGKTKNRRLVISKNRDQGMYRYVSVR